MYDHPCGSDRIVVDPKAIELEVIEPRGRWGGRLTIPFAGHQPATLGILSIVTTLGFVAGGLVGPWLGAFASAMLGAIAITAEWADREEISKNRDRGSRAIAAPGEG